MNTTAVYNGGVSRLHTVEVSPLMSTSRLPQAVVVVLALWSAFVVVPVSSEAALGAGVGPIPQWIWADPYPKSKQTATFRKAFDVAVQPAAARLSGLADDDMTVYVNGHRVAEIKESKQIATFDVTAQIRPGRNVLSLCASNRIGPAGVMVRLELIGPGPAAQSIVTDQSWLASLSEERGWHATGFDASGWPQAVSFGQLGVQPWGDPLGASDDYNQWKQALGKATATGLARITAPPGFAVELICSAGEGEGSWVSLAFDPRGRLIVGREDQGLLRLTLPRAENERPKIETINETLKECRGLLFAFESLYVNANNSKALYRLRDTNGDDQFDEVKLLRKTEGGVGHGRNGMALGPDNRIYLVHGNDVRLPSGFTTGTSPLRNYAGDRLLTPAWDQQLFNAGVRLPAGHIVRTDRDGETWEIIAGGFRNPFGVAFNTDGEMFTYDADMEGDIGAPWYRPTRINHIVSGGDYGWRQGTSKWPAFYPDSPPSNLDIGKGSPTGVKFGTKSRFPPKYRRALFALDWAYGRIFAVHLTASGASYVGSAETFIEGRPLNVTALDFGPDGAMYFITGGRRTQSGLYRVRYVGEAVKQRPATPQQLSRRRQAARARRLRRELEAFHGHRHPQAVETAWPHLGSSDPWIRHAARIAVEHQPPETWQQRALAEPYSTAGLTALLALSRVGDADLQPKLLDRLNGFPLNKCTAGQQLIALRADAICFSRMSRPDDMAAAKVIDRLDPLYPAQTVPVNQLLCELLVYLRAPNVLRKSIPLLNSASTQEERLFFLYVLRNVKSGWTLEQRRTYFHWLREAADFRGGQSMPKFVSFIRSDALATLTNTQREQLAPILAAKKQQPADIDSRASNRSFVKDWKVTDLSSSLDDVDRGRDFQRGKAMYTAALCVRCHRFGSQGTAIGPDLTDVGRRFDRLALLESMMTPSKVVNEKFRDVKIVTTKGFVIVGRIVGGTAKTLTISTNPLTPEETTAVVKADIEFQTTSGVSPMPLGLLNTLSKDEILDLLAYLEAGGNPAHPSFRP